MLIIQEGQIVFFSVHENMSAERRYETKVYYKTINEESQDALLSCWKDYNLLKFVGVEN